MHPGAAKKVSLRQAATHGAQALDLGRLFNALGDDFTVQLSGQRQDHVDYILLVRSACMLEMSERSILRTS